MPSDRAKKARAGWPLVHFPLPRQRRRASAPVQLLSNRQHRYRTAILHATLGCGIVTALGSLLYLVFGHALIKVAYESNAAIVKVVMAGKLVTPLESYLAAADDLVFTIAFVLILWALVLSALVFSPSRTILALCSSAICFFIAEMGVRLAFRNVTTTADNSSYLARQWQKKIRENTSGFRDREFQSIKPGHVYRIAVIGDSLTWGQGISEEDRFSNRLEGRLNQTGTAYEVLNFGKPGMDTAAELQILQNHVFPLKPDFVLLQWYTNDVDGFDKSWLRPGMPLIPSSYISWPLRTNSLLFWLMEQRWASLQEKLGLTVFFEDAVLGDFTDPEGEPWTKAKTTLQKFINACKQEGIPLGIVLFSDSYFRPTSKLDFLTDRVLKICSDTLTPCLDLRPAFVRYNGDLQLWVNRLDPHPSALANSIATGRLIERFHGMWLKDHSRPGRVLVVPPARAEPE